MTERAPTHLVVDEFQTVDNSAVWQFGTARASAPAGMIEHMFDDLPDPAGLADAASAVAAIQSYVRAEAFMAARVRQAVAVLMRIREAEASEERQRWVVDAWASTSHEVGLAAGISARRASGVMRQAHALSVRFPRLGTLLQDGVINARVAAIIVWRTGLVDNPAVAAKIDAALAERAEGFGVLSDDDLELAIDAVIEEHDPDASRRYRDAAKNLDVQFGKLDDAAGTRSVHGRVSAVAAETARQVLAALVATVCKQDPRSQGQLRAAAFEAHFAGQNRLMCQCGTPDCPAADANYRNVSNVVIHVLADPDTVLAALEEAADYAASQPPLPTDAAAEAADTADPFAWLTATPEPNDGDEEPPWVTAQTPAAPAPAERDHPDSTAPQPSDRGPAAVGNGPPATSSDAADGQRQPDGHPPPPPQPEPSPRRWCRAAVMLGAREVIPTPLLAELIRKGARLEALPTPADASEGGRYPSPKLRRWLLCRDMTCRMPGCSRPAEYADVDHTIPHPAGPTHPSNLKCYCRLCHLLKTFWDGPDGWREVQHPDGSITVIAPTGHTYIGHPTSRLLFPGWDTTTAELPPSSAPSPKATNRGLKMPKRSRTRAEDNAQRIKAERERNAARRHAEREPNTKEDRPPPP